tara:strand:+ start:1708 stop:1911 length:204 start_codon:yes stop_codon:yes gene_type:complete
MGNKYQKELKRKGIDTSSRGDGKDAALDAALKNIMKDPGYTPSPSHERWQVKKKKTTNVKWEKGHPV